MTVFEVTLILVIQEKEGKGSDWTALVTSTFAFQISYSTATTVACSLKDQIMNRCRFTYVLFLIVCWVGFVVGRLEAGLILRIKTDNDTRTYTDSLGTGYIMARDHVDGLTFSLTLAKSKPNAPNNGFDIGDLHLTSVHVLNGGQEDVRFSLEATDTDFELPGLAAQGFGRMKSDLRILKHGGSVTYQSFLNRSNVAFDKEGPGVVTSGPLSSTGSLGEDFDYTGGKFSLTAYANVTVKKNSAVGFLSGTQIVPEPGVILSILAGLVGLVGVRFLRFGRR